MTLSPRMTRFIAAERRFYELDIMCQNALRRRNKEEAKRILEQMKEQSSIMKQNRTGADAAA